jgi:hypothetical protein
MSAIDIGHQTAGLFGALWQVRRSPWFFRFIEVAFGTRVSELPVLKAVLISEAESGNVQHGWVQSLTTRHGRTTWFVLAWGKS